MRVRSNKRGRYGEKKGRERSRRVKRGEKGERMRKLYKVRKENEGILASYREKGNKTSIYEKKNGKKD